MFCKLHKESISKMAINDKWKKVIFDIVKYALGAVLGAAGFSLTGCASIPVFMF